MEEEKVIEQQSSPDGSKLDEAAAAEEGREDVNNYPSRKIVVPAMVSIYLAVFLIALVQPFSSDDWVYKDRESYKLTLIRRTAPFLALLSRPFRMSSRALAILPGTKLASSFLCARCSCHSDAYM